jgi:membrane fusion protein, heavy metal efflux system
MHIMRPKTLGTSLAILGAALVLLAACSKPVERTAPQTPPQPAVGAALSGAKCAAHGAPKELCFICDASLRDKGRLWCDEHDRYEDRCFECHPELQDKTRLWCAEHSLYEDECFLCHPELRDQASAAPAGSALLCKEHNVPEQECGICHPELLGQKRVGEGLQVRLPSAESAERAGVVVATVGAEGPEGVADGVDCLAELTFDQNRIAQITPLIGGVLLSVEVDLGSRVRAGQLLARVTSAGLGEVQNAYLRALAEEELRNRSVERERRLRTQGISSERELQEAEAAHQSATAAVRQAQQQLTVLGLDEQQIRNLAEQKRTPGVLEIRAPFAGEIVERTAVAGAVVETGKPLFTLADPATLWAMVDIPESQLSRARVGQTVQLAVEAFPGRVFGGTLTWLSAGVDEHTRLARGRVVVPNADRSLKARMFARARILTSGPSRAVTVPQSAVQDVTGTSVVFLRRAADLFEARAVQLGPKHDGQVEILAGLRPAEQVVVAGSFALKSQFLISRLGAGCVD